ISSERLWVEECRVLNASQLPKMLDQIQPDLSQNPYIAIEGVQVEATITKPHFGGVRYWFVCPKCRRRVRRLYLPEPDKLACRTCLRLVYEWQFRKNWRWQLLREAGLFRLGKNGHKRLNRITARALGLDRDAVRTLCEEQLSWANICLATHL